MRNIILFSLLSALISCNTATLKTTDTPEQDSLLQKEVTNTDTIISSLDSSTTPIYEADEAAINASKIEQTFGKQWDFCDCIHKTDSIQKAIENVEEISDEAFDLLMARFEEIDQHCKTLITNPNTNPEDRQAHQRKVKKCLKNKQ